MVGADITEVTAGMGLDPRIGPRVSGRWAWLGRLVFPEGHFSIDSDGLRI